MTGKISHEIILLFTYVVFVISSICLIDDDIEFLEPLQTILEDAKYQVVSFSRPDDAFTYLRTNKIDIVITDYCLPGMTGTELLLKLQIMGRNIPTAFCVTGSDLLNQVEAFRCGAEAVFAKPFSSKILLETLSLFNLSKSVELSKAFLRTMNESSWALIKIEDLPIFQCKILRFSKDGFFGYCINKIPKLNVAVKVIIQIDDASGVGADMELDGEIKWVTLRTMDNRYACGVGVKLTLLTPEKLQKIQGLITQRPENES